MPAPVLLLLVQESGFAHRKVGMFAFWGVLPLERAAARSIAGEAPAPAQASCKMLLQ